jgi:hypothetical protein
MFEMRRRRVVVGVPFLRADVTAYERERSCIPRFPTRWHPPAIDSLPVDARVACNGTLPAGRGLVGDVWLHALHLLHSLLAASFESTSIATGAVPDNRAPSSCAFR